MVVYIVTSMPWFPHEPDYGEDILAVFSDKQAAREWIDEQYMLDEEREDPPYSYSIVSKEVR